MLGGILNKVYLGGIDDTARLGQFPTCLNRVLVLLTINWPELEALRNIESDETLKLKSKHLLRVLRVKKKMNDWNLFAAKLGQMVKDSKMEVSNIKHKKQVPSLSMA